MSAAEGGPLRRAGTGKLADGSVVTWSVAEGDQGRRWRWTVAARDVLRQAGLVELDPTGRFMRLELETAGGMLTLHPAADRGTAHGNVVRMRGVEPIEVAWSDEATVGIVGDPFGSAVAGWQGRGWAVSSDLRLRRATQGETDDALDRDDRGVPRLLEAVEWRLEA